MDALFETISGSLLFKMLALTGVGAPLALAVVLVVLYILTRLIFAANSERLSYKNNQLHGDIDRLQSIRDNGSDAGEEESENDASLKLHAQQINKKRLKGNRFFWRALLMAVLIIVVQFAVIFIVAGTILFSLTRYYDGANCHWAPAFQDGQMTEFILSILANGLALETFNIAQPPFCYLTTINPFSISVLLLRFGPAAIIIGSIREMMRAVALNRRSMQVAEQRIKAITATA